MLETTLRMNLLNIKVKGLTFVLCVILFGCNNDEEGPILAIETYPGLVGSWKTELPCYDPCPIFTLRFNENGEGYYNKFHDATHTTTTFEGAATLDENNTVFIDGEAFFTIKYNTPQN